MPFDQRVLIFRSLVAADKERCCSRDGSFLDCLPTKELVALQIVKKPVSTFPVQLLPLVLHYMKCGMRSTPVLSKASEASKRRPLGRVARAMIVQASWMGMPC